MCLSDGFVGVCVQMWVPREEIRREYTGWKEMRVEDVEHVLGPDLVRQAPNGPDVEEVLALAQRTAAQRTARPSYTLPGALYDPTTLAPTRFGEAVIGNAVTLRLDDNETDEDDEDNVPPPGYDNHDDPRREVDNTVQAHIDTIGDALERLDDKNDDPTPTPTTRLQQQVAAAVPHVLFRGKPDEDNDHLGDVGAHGLNVPTREQEQAKNKNLTHIVDAIRKVLHGLQREEDDDDAIRKVLLELQHEDDDDDDDKDLIANGGWETALAHLALCKRHEQDAAADEYMHDANAGADEYMHMFTDEWRPSVRAAAASLVALWKAHEDDDNMAAAKALVDHLGVCFLREVRAGVDREVVITHTASAVVAKTVDAIIAAWKKRDPSVLCALGQFVDMDEDMDDRKKMFRVHIDKPVLTDVENALKEHDRPAASLHGDAAAAMLGPGLVAGTPMHPAWTTPTKPALRFLARVLGYQASTSRSSSSPTLADKTVVCWTDPADGKTRCATSLANVFFTGGIDRQGHMAFRLLGKTTKDCDLIVICRLFVDPQTGGVGLRQISKGDHLDVRAWLPGNLESVLRRAVAEMLRARAAEAKARADEDEKDEDEEQKNDHAKEEVVLRYLFYPWQAERYLHDIEAGRAFMPLVDELFATIMRGEASRADALAVMKAASEPVSRKDAARKGLKRVLDMLLFLADRTDDVKDSRDVNARVLYALTEAGLFDPTKNTLLCLPWEHGARTRFNLAEWYTVVSETEITRAEALANEAVASARAIAEATAAARADVEEAMKDDDEEDKDEEDDEDDDEDDEEGTTRKRTRTGEDGESRRKRRKKDDDAPQQRQRQQPQQPAPGAPRKRRRP